MKNMKNLFSIIILLSTLIYANLSVAYTPSAYALVQDIFKQFSFEMPLLVEQNVFMPDKSEMKLFASTEAFIKYPYSFRVKINSDLQREYVVKDDEFIEIDKDTIISFNRNMALYFFELFSFNEIDPFLNYLSAMKIDYTKITMGIIGDDINYVIGTDNINKQNNQLWIDKKTRLPSKIILFNNNGEFVDIFKYEFSEYGLADRLYFPKSIKCYSNDKLELEFTSTKVVRTKLDDENIFNTKKIRQKYKINTATSEKPLFR